MTVGSAAGMFSMKCRLVSVSLLA